MENRKIKKKNIILIFFSISPEQNCGVEWEDRGQTVANI